MRLFLTVICLFVWVGVSGFLCNRWERMRELRLAEDNAVLETTYRASLAMYRMATEIFVNQEVQIPEVITVVAQGMHSQGRERSLARGKLYRMLSPTYAYLKSHGIQQLHFHTADGHSYLRFHAPDKFDDELFELRPSLRQVNSDLLPSYGLEIGRLNLGFRYVYPLFEGENHLGSVEAGVTFRAISESMAGIDPGREYQLLLRRDAIDRVLFDDYRQLFRVSSLSDDFLVEDERLSLPVSPLPASSQVKAVNALLKSNPRVAEGLASERPFSLSVSTEDGDWAVCFVPERDVSDTNVAYVLSYSRAPYLLALRHELFFNLAVVSLATAGLLWLSLWLHKTHGRLVAEKKHLQTVTDTIGDGLCVMDARGVVVQVNPVFSEILGFSAGEIVGKIGHDLFHVHGDGSRIPLADCPILQATSARETFSGEAVFRHCNGKLLIVELTCKPLLKEGVLVGSVTAFRDITARKEAQQRLLDSDRIKGEFIATASHELRTPLAVIQGYTEYLLENAHLDIEQAREFEKTILVKAVALEKIIDDLLDVSRIEAGRPVSLERETVNLGQEIRLVALQFEKEDRQHPIRVHLPTEDVLISLDKYKVIQVLENLFNNAVKFSPKGSEITVRLEVLGEKVQVEVTDQGVGILPEQQPYIFDKFFRVDTSNTSVSGFGLGLYLCQRIVEAHGGVIWVESIPGKFTSFFFTLPLKG